jgi:hypothetical protein
MIGLVVCCGLVLAQCATSMATPPTTAPIAKSVSGSVVIGADDRTILYDSSSLCDGASLAATETPDTVRLTLYTPDADTYNCSRRIWSGAPTVSAFLPTPVNGRRIVDAVSGRTVPSLAENDVLRPRKLPTGWTERVPGDPFSAVTTVMDYFGGPGAAVLVESFSGAGTSTGRLSVIQVAGGGWNPPAGTVTAAITVRGHPGLAAPGIIVWTESGHVVAVMGERGPVGPVLPAPFGAPDSRNGTPLTTVQLKTVAATLIGPRT